MLRLRPSLSEFLARPGCPRSYTRYQASRLLGLTETAVGQLIRKHKVQAVKSKGRWWIPRSSVILLARKCLSDRSIALARILCGEGRMIALVNDPDVRKMLAPHNPLYCSSTFSLGQQILVTGATSIVVDWEVCGSEWARDIAERMRLCPDRPKLVGVLPEYQDQPGRGWDGIIRRPCKRSEFEKVIRNLP